MLTKNNRKMYEEITDYYEVMDYCKQHGPMLEEMTTPAIVQHLKAQFPEAANKNPMVLVSALGEWCRKHRPGIVG
ncbi:hypothetical protein [Desulfofalx alkaliphila]|uniref:hypothetical protein n=1 Tax=Desulfofalx alkaliphila TaxID=105483 RepID=UPI0004E0D6EF|nr:hypothetical protein [Desulfofalx alkaliphila]